LYQSALPLPKKRDDRPYLTLTNRSFAIDRKCSTPGATLKAGQSIEYLGMYVMEDARCVNSQGIMKEFQK
jgi:hypothetical protein